MNSFATGFLLTNAAMLLLLPRRWAPLPLLLGTCYMTLGQAIEIGPFSFTVVRMLVLVGVVRIIVRGERLAGGVNSLDRLILVWAVWAVFSSAFHKDPSSALTLRLGLVFNACGIYFLLRVFCRSLDDVAGLCRITAILLVPLAAEMINEKLTTHNIFSSLAGVSEITPIRDGKIRAQGPFGHSILAGTVGAVSLPLVIALWHTHRKGAVLGIAACMVMVYASASSGPIMTTLAAVGAVWMWIYREHMRAVRWLAVLGYIGLDLIMKAPAYYLIARIDLTGSSTSWHRAALIESAIGHLSEWWLAGADYTRHWMPTGVSWSPVHTDITNYYIKMGVIGGLPLMLLFIAILAMGFSFVGRVLSQTPDMLPQQRFMVWALGASLFAHSVTFLAVSYFDQSFVFIYLTLAVIGSAHNANSMQADSVLNRSQAPIHPLLIRTV